MARISHPNVVHIYEIGETEGVSFIVMDLVEGETLREWLTVAPRGVREILDVFIAAGTGLVAAHEAQLVHRDFKPDNVMVRRDGQVVVLDLSDGGPLLLSTQFELDWDRALDPDDVTYAEPRRARIVLLANGPSLVRRSS